MLAGGRVAGKRLARSGQPAVSSARRVTKPPADGLQPGDCERLPAGAASAATAGFGHAARLLVAAEAAPAAAM